MLQLAGPTGVDAGLLGLGAVAETVNARPVAGRVAQAGGFLGPGG